jgi:hypothetical protein
MATKKPTRKASQTFTAEERAAMTAADEKRIRALVEKAVC